MAVIFWYAFGNPYRSGRLRFPLHYYFPDIEYLHNEEERIYERFHGVKDDLRAWSMKYMYENPRTASEVYAAAGIDYDQIKHGDERKTIPDERREWALFAVMHLVL
jgi:hypothetical protein